MHFLETVVIAAVLIFVEISDKGIDGRCRSLWLATTEDEVCVAVECHLLFDDNKVEPEFAIILKIQKQKLFIS